MGLSGAGAACLLDRHSLRDWARHWLAVLSKLVLLTRLSPAFLFSLLNLAYGLSEVSLRDYTIGLIGILATVAVELPA